MSEPKNTDINPEFAFESDVTNDIVDIYSEPKLKLKQIKEYSHEKNSISILRLNRVFSIL